MAGRKGQWGEWLTKDGLLTIEGWARDGLREKQIAQNIGIGVSTLAEWKNRFPELLEAIKRGKRPADVQVENALFRSAIGFTKTLRKPIKLRRKDGSEYIDYAEEEVYIAPQITAQIFWLKNRKPEFWRDKPVAPPKVDEIDDGFLKALEDTAPDDWSEPGD